ncbi:MAG: helix-turn-helix domain-containing protein [Lactovum sp.]
MEKTIGLLLKEQRTTFDWSLDQAEKQTSIKKIYISALETENYSVFPGAFYVRAYLKQYSDKLGLDTEVILEAYDNHTLIEVEGELDEIENYRFERPEERTSLNSTNAHKNTYKEKKKEKEKEEKEEIQVRVKRYLPMILLSSVAIIIVVVVALIVFINYPEISQPSKDSYSLSQTLVSSSSLNESKNSTSNSSIEEKETVLTLSEDGSKLNIETEAEQVEFMFMLKSDYDSAVATLSSENEVSQTIELSKEKMTESLFLKKELTSANITVTDISAFMIVINGQEIDFSSVQMLSNILDLEIIYKK